MHNQRPVTLLAAGTPTVEGAGVRLRRIFGQPEVPRFDPFLLLDDFGSNNPDDYIAGFPWHPHRGIETVTYMLSGSVEHSDSLGNRGVIGAGDVQWMTAGRGIIHQEMPQRSDGPLQGLQLWVNLPSAAKMCEPQYRGIESGDIPLVSPHSGLRIRVVAGEVAGTRGPVQDVSVDPQLLDIVLEPGADLEHPTPVDHTVFFYAIEGSGRVGANAAHELRQGELALFGAGGSVTASTGRRPFRFLLAAGRPLAEPVAWSGPIVMNTDEQLAAAFREYREGRFVTPAEP